MSYYFLVNSIAFFISLIILNVAVLDFLSNCTFSSSSYGDNFSSIVSALGVVYFLVHL